jgi:hypothetical protein
MVKVYLKINICPIIQHGGSIKIKAVSSVVTLLIPIIFSDKTLNYLPMLLIIYTIKAKEISNVVTLLKIYNQDATPVTYPQTPPTNCNHRGS